MSFYDLDHNKSAPIGEKVADNSHSPRNQLRSETVLRAACINHGVTRIELLSSSRAMRYVRARWSAMLVLREVEGLALLRIAALLRRQDHTTILNGIRRAKDFMRVDPDYRDAVERVRQTAIAEKFRRQP